MSGRERGSLTRVADRNDDKTAEEYGLEGGATLHLVLALRGGCSVQKESNLRRRS